MSASAHKRPPKSAPASDIGWTTVGWQGVSVRVPEEWSPVSVSGEGETGYLRVASPDTRSLEIKWEETKGAVSVPDALARYFKKLARTAKKSRHVLTIKERPKQLGSLRPQNQAPISYSWEADRRALGVIWHCGDCRRLVIAELVGAADDDLSLARTILKSIAEHGRDGWNTWGLYGLVIAVPAEYRIESQQLTTGYLKLAFRHRAQALVVERWGLANVVLKEVSAARWFTVREAQRLSRFRYREDEIEVRGHCVTRLEGGDRLLPAAARTIQSIARLSLPALRFHGYVWDCPDSNKIFAITGQARKGGDVTRQVFERFVCHSQVDG
jgi:hypothetical protein